MKLNRKTKSPETRDQVASMHFCHQFSVCAILPLSIRSSLEALKPFIVNELSLAAEGVATACLVQGCKSRRPASTMENTNGL